MSLSPRSLFARPVGLGLAGLLLAVLLLAATGLGVVPVRAQAPVPTPAELAGLAGKHPADYYLKAGELFQAGRKDDATFVFYLGQLRYRVHLKARPTLPPDKDAAAFSALSEMVGRPINGHAFGDIPQLARIIDAVLAYDTANPDAFTPPTEFAKAHAEVRAGLDQLKAHVLREADNIRATRARNGLPNRAP